jgi:hypothetical protein
MTPMRVLAIFAVHVLVAVIGASGALARVQARPDFSGRWVIVQPEKGAGQEQIIKHDARTLSKTPVGDRGGPPATYQLDGVEHRTMLPRRGQEIVSVTKAVWEGNTLVITIVENYPTGMKLNVKEVWALDAQGRLVIEATESTEGQKPQVMRIVLQKKGRFVTSRP